MFRRILFLFSKEISGLHQAAYLLAFFTFLSQILGFFRDRLLAHTFGAGSVLDVYYASFRIPDLILVIAASIVSLTVLIPFLTEKIEKDKEEGKKFIDGIFTVFFLSIVVIAALFFFISPWILPLIFSGLAKAGHTQELVTLTRILLLSPILLGLSNLFASVVQVYRRFFVYALSPIMYNLGIIVGVLFLYPSFGMAGLAYGVILGALLHLLILFPTVIRKGFFPHFKLSISWEVLWKVIRHSIPRALTLSFGQLALLFLIAFAALMHEGSISIFNFSFNLQSVPLSIIGVSYSLAAFPTLSKLFTNGEKQEFVKQITSAARHIVFWSIPAFVLFIVLRAQIVRTVLGSGEFGWSDTRLTAAALALFVVSIIAQGLVLLFVRSYYAMGNTRKPLLASIISTLSIGVFSYVFVLLFKNFSMVQYFFEALLRVEDVPGTLVLMLPLAYSLGMFIYFFLLLIFFKRDIQINFSLTRAFFETFSASVIMGFVTYRFLFILDGVFDIQTLPGIFLQGLSSGIIGIISGIFILKILGNPELVEVWNSFKAKLWKVDLIVPEREEL